MPLILDSPTPSPSPPPHHDHDAALRRREHHAADAVIVGAGVLGTALAVMLARQGRSVLLLEQSLKEPDRIVGELLQPGGVEALEQLGLRSCLGEIDAIVVRGYEVVYYGTGVHIPYPENAVAKGKRPEGRSFHHGRFIRRLREVAMTEPNITVVETKVTGVVRSDYSHDVLGVESLTRGKRDYYFGSLTFVADGYDSKFRKEFIPHTPKAWSKFYGLEMKDAVLPRSEHGCVILGDGAPVLIYQIGTHETRILVDVPHNTPSASVAQGGVKGHLKNVVLPSLPKCVQPAFQEALDEGKLRSMPNSWLPPSTNRTPGLVLLGDAMNMRHPLTGGGMTVALNDVVLLRSLLAPEVVPNLGEAEAVKTQMRRFHWQRKNLTSVINILAQALYQLFAADGASSLFSSCSC
jgi:squalene monooxygenase